MRRVFLVLLLLTLRIDVDDHLYENELFGVILLTCSPRFNVVSRLIRYVCFSSFIEWVYIGLLCD